ADTAPHPPQRYPDPRAPPPWASASNTTLPRPAGGSAPTETRPPGTPTGPRPARGAAHGRTASPAYPGETTRTDWRRSRIPQPPGPGTPTPSGGSARTPAPGSRVAR